MNRFQCFVGVALFAALFASGSASGQTATKINVASGSGQIICQCFGSGQVFYQPLVVRVTDASGRPVPNADVSWSVASGGAFVQLLVSDTFTDGNGYSTGTVLPVNLPIGVPYQEFVQSSIVATSSGSSVSFVLTAALNVDGSLFGLSALPGVPLLFQYSQPGGSLTTASSFSGQAGTTVNPPLQVKVVTLLTHTPVPNIGVRLVNTVSGASTIQCAESAGGDNTALSDATGTATCTAVFGGTPKVAGLAYLSVGGGYNSDHFSGGDPNSEPSSFTRYPADVNGGFTVTTLPGAPSVLRLISGSGQSQLAGQAFSAPLTVAVQGASGNAISGQTVTWTVSPTGSATLSPASGTTDANGQASTRVTLAGTASGTVTVTASLAGATNVTPVNFTLTATQPVTYTGLTMIQGNNQSAIVNTTFAIPLVVQLNATTGPVSGIPVTFTTTGPVTLSPSTTATTGPTGQASITVLATGTAGAATVTASVGGSNLPAVTFNLTVSPPGPSLTSASQFMNAADFQRGALSPCSLATLIAQGLAPGLQGMLVGSLFGPLPYNLGGDTVTVGGSSAPILNMGLNVNGQQQITFQVPCDVTPGSSVAVVVNVGAGNATINIPVQAASPGVFQTAMSDGVYRAVVVRPDGSFASLQNPARPGENLVAFATGLGAPSSPVGTNSVAAPGAVVSTLGKVVVGMAGRGVPLVSATLSDELLGVWMVTFTVPNDLPSGNNQTFSISVIPAGSNTPIPSATTTIPLKQ